MVPGVLWFLLQRSREYSNLLFFIWNLYEIVLSHINLDTWHNKCERFTNIWNQIFCQEVHVKFGASNCVFIYTTISKVSLRTTCRGEIHRFLKWIAAYQETSWFACSVNLLLQNLTCQFQLKINICVTCDLFLFASLPLSCYFNRVNHADERKIWSALLRHDLCTFKHWNNNSNILIHRRHPGST